MMRYKAVLRLSVLFFFLALVIPVHAQVEEETGSQGGGALGGLLNILGTAAQQVLQDEVQEEIDDWAGTYKGRIGEVVLLERRGNAVSFEVKYEGVKRSDGVYVTGEVLKWGEAQEGFNTTVSPVQEKNGSVRLTIGREQQDDSGWGLPSEATDTDQIRLSLVRETNPEKPFGELVYDFPKTWTDSSNIETLPEENETAEEEGEGSIELADGETSESTAGDSAAKPSVSLVRPGSLMLPNKTAVIQQSAAVADSAPAQSAAAAAPSTAGVRTTRNVVTEYDFFENADKAKWKNATADLNFPGSINDQAGFVRTLVEGQICPDNKAENLLETHPQWVNRGTIEGSYPLMYLGSNVKFKATGALIKGAESSDGVIMQVLVLCDGKQRTVLRKRIDSKNYTALEGDLSEWAGKKVQIVLKVWAGETSTKDWAVWVHPRLTAN